jgi:cell division protein FtsB
MEVLQAYWHQIIFIIGLIVVAVKLSAQVKTLERDLAHLTKRDTYVEVVKLIAQVDQLQSQNAALWDFTNKLRDKFNGNH